MAHAIIAPLCIDNPLTEDGRRRRQSLSYLVPELASLGAFTATMPERVEHVAYPSLVDDPLATVERVVTASGIGIDEDMASRVERFLDAQRSGTRAVPPRELATLAYDHDELTRSSATIAEGSASYPNDHA